MSNNRTQPNYSHHLGSPLAKIDLSPPLHHRIWLAHFWSFFFFFYLISPLVSSRIPFLSSFGAACPKATPSFTCSSSFPLTFSCFPHPCQSPGLRVSPVFHASSQRQLHLNITRADLAGTQAGSRPVPHARLFTGPLRPPRRSRPLVLWRRWNAS